MTLTHDGKNPVRRTRRSVRAHWLAAALAATAGAGGLIVTLPSAAQPAATYDSGMPAPQIAGDREDVADPPGRAGRLADVQGSAWLFHPEAGDWIVAQRNRPLTTGDRLSTEADGRLDLRIGSTAFRMDGNTEVEVVRLDDDAIELELHGGSLSARLRSTEATREVSIVTADGRFTMQKLGRYRFDRRDGTSRVTVWAGQALYEGPGSALTVQAGQRAEFWLDGQQRAQYGLSGPAHDAFSAWVAEADRRDDAVASRYVSPEMTGAEDLERYGRWDQDAEYGAIWTPTTVAANWAPYSTGHWAWVSPWGWTWVDDAPWGYAPFHYGRWVMVRDRWCWAPGRYVSRPVYAPALVGWIGGGGASVSIGVGRGPGVGWFPLAPREAWYPGYRVSSRYVRTVNGPHYRSGADLDRLVQSPLTVIRGAEYRNRKFHHGTTAAPVEAFQRRGPITVSPQWRAGAPSRDYDRLPATPVGVIGPPPGLVGQGGRGPGRGPDGRDPRDGRGGPDGRDPRDGRQPWRDAGRGPDGRPPAPSLPIPGTPGAVGAIGAPSGALPTGPRDGRPPVNGNRGDQVGRPFDRDGNRGDPAGRPFEQGGNRGDTAGRPFDRDGNRGDVAGRPDRDGGRPDSSGRPFDPGARPADRVGRPFDRDGDRQGEWPGRNRPGQPDGGRPTVAQPTPQPVMPMQPAVPVAPPAPVAAPQPQAVMPPMGRGDDRGDRPQRGFDRGDRGDRPFQGQGQGDRGIERGPRGFDRSMQAPDAPRPMAPAMPAPPPVAMPAPAAPPAMAPQRPPQAVQPPMPQRPPEPPRAAPLPQPQPAFTPPGRNRDPREGGGNAGPTQGPEGGRRRPE